MTVYRCVADPYRETSDRSSRRVIARRSASALAGSMLLAAAGLATPMLAARWADDYPSLFVLACVAFPAGLFALGRTVHACFVPHVIELDARGLHFAWGTKITLVPWLRREDREVEWAALHRVETRTVSVNGYATTSLVVTTEHGAFEVPDGSFDHSAHEMQREILDHLDRAHERPIGTVSAFAEACRERFATPQHFVASPRGIIGAFAFFLPFMSFGVWLAIVTPFWLTYGFAALCVLLFGGITVLGVSQWWRHRVLELGPDALAIGSSPERARRIPWDSIRTVRRQMTNRKIDGIEIIADDGTRITLRHDYGRRLDDLARMIDPASILPSEPSRRRPCSGTEP